MSTKILESMKKMLGDDVTSNHFDVDIRIHINSVFMDLNRLGVGPTKTFVLKEDDVEWDEFMNGNEDIEGVKTYMYLNLRLFFDPPQQTSLLAAIQRQIDKYEWTLNVISEGE